MEPENYNFEYLREKLRGVICELHGVERQCDEDNFFKMRLIKWIDCQKDKGQSNGLNWEQFINWIRENK